jgi:hypothetical protein
MEKKSQTQDRVLARLTAADLSEVVGGLAPEASVTITTADGQFVDITNVDGDSD